MPCGKAAAKVWKINEKNWHFSLLVVKFPVPEPSFFYRYSTAVFDGVAFPLYSIAGAPMPVHCLPVCTTSL
jgi:hypothetical protein